MTQLGSLGLPPGLTPDERAELARLRLQVGGTGPARERRRRIRWRSVVTVVLIVLGCVLAPVAGDAVWTSNQVSNTDRFVRTVSPLVDHPDVQEALTNRVTAIIFQYVDVRGWPTRPSRRWWPGICRHR